MAEPKIILFDCDGTLVDSEALSAAAVSTALGSYGVQMSPKDVNHEFIGVHLTNILRIIDARHGTDISYDDFVDAYTREMLVQVPKHIRVLPDTVEYIKSLHERGVLMAVGSNGVRSVVLAELKAVGLLQYFDAVVTADDVENPKPFPDMFLEGMKMLGGSSPESCLVVEDSIPGLKAAQAAGMIAVGYTGLNHDPKVLFENLTKAGAHTVLKDLQSLDLLLK